MRQRQIGWAIRLDPPAGQRATRYVGKRSCSIARARFNAQHLCPRRKPEHKNRVWLVFGEQSRQVTVDGRVAGLKNMGDDRNLSEGRSSQPCKTFDDMPSGIEWCARKWPEAGDQNCERGHLDTE